MRPAEFTLEQIVQAGQALQAAGRNITGFALRSQVGGGNPTRLKQVWDEYVSRETETKAEPVAELPVEVAEKVAAVTKELIDGLSKLAIELNDKAVKAAERRVAEVVRTAGEQREQAERELVDASQTVEDLEAKLDEARAEAKALEARLADRQTAFQAQAVELAQVRERLALTEQTARETAEEHATALAEIESLREAVALSVSAEAGLKATVEQMTRQIQVLTSELERGHAEHEAARQAHEAELARATEAARTAHAEHEAARQAHAAELARAMEAARTAQGEASDLRAKLDDRSAALQQAHEREAAIKVDLTKVQTEAARAAADRDQLQNSLDKATSERDGSRAELAGLRDQLTALTAQRDSLTSERDSLRAQNASQLDVIARFSPGAASQG